MPDPKLPEDPERDAKLRIFFEKRLEKASELYPVTENDWERFKERQKEKNGSRPKEEKARGYAPWFTLKIAVGFAALLLLGGLIWKRQRSDGEIVLAAANGGETVRDPQL